MYVLKYTCMCTVCVEFDFLFFLSSLCAYHLASSPSLSLLSSLPPTPSPHPPSLPPFFLFLPLSLPLSPLPQFLPPSLSPSYLTELTVIYGSLFLSSHPSFNHTLLSCVLLSLLSLSSTQCDIDSAALYAFFSQSMPNIAWDVNKLVYKCTQCERDLTLYLHTRTHIQAWKMSCSDLFSHLLCNIIHVCTHIHTHTRIHVHPEFHTLVRQHYMLYIHLYITQEN